MILVKIKQVFYSIRSEQADVVKCALAMAKTVATILLTMENSCNEIKQFFDNVPKERMCKSPIIKLDIKFYKI